MIYNFNRHCEDVGYILRVCTRQAFINRLNQQGLQLRFP